MEYILSITFYTGLYMYNFRFTNHPTRFASFLWFLLRQSLPVLFATVITHEQTPTWSPGLEGPEADADDVEGSGGTSDDVGCNASSAAGADDDSDGAGHVVDVLRFRLK
uniref:Transmembrane protein n=1 Tax=Angiostrongylus cantonensis TaxID=6313 RepID=A0A0K0DLZ0_ANGCA